MKIDHDPNSNWELVKKTGLYTHKRTNTVGRRRFLLTSLGSVGALALLTTRQRNASALELPSLPKLPKEVTNLVSLSAEQIKAFTEPNKLGQRLITHDTDTGNGSYQIALFSTLLEELNAIQFDKSGEGSWLKRITEIETHGNIQTLLAVFKRRKIDLLNPPTLESLPSLPVEIGFRFALGTRSDASTYIDSSTIDIEDVPALNLMQFIWAPRSEEQPLALNSARAFLTDTRQEYPLFPNPPKFPPRKIPGVQAPQS